MIQRCPRCGQKNRLPETMPKNGEYRCGQCQAVLQSGSRVLRMLKDIPLLLSGIYVLLLAALTLSNSIGPERWWLGSLNLYLPQWPWAIPGGLLLLLTLCLRRWKLCALNFSGLLWVFGPIMGFSTGGLHPSVAGTGTPIRVMTYNVKWSSRDGHAISEDIARYHPDLLQMQDSSGVMLGEVGQALKGWNVRIDGQYLIASPHPLPALESRDISFDGSDHHCVRYLLKIGGRTVTVYDVHLLSPREGLMSVGHSQTEGMSENADYRQEEALRLAGYVNQEQGPVVLTGDLNAPVQSLVCRSLFDAGLRDAFSEAGVGYGYTYGRFTHVGQPYVRIDHIMVSKQWQVTRCTVGNEIGSDHCPVIADLVLSNEK
ncbi:MAG: endonuclease/exonuclease/phosphatase family protein [Janthinobacterium lividum]